MIRKSKIRTISQISTSNRLRKRCDNGDVVKKIVLRRKMTETVENANIFLAGCGQGSMLRSIWHEKADYVLAVDNDPVKIHYVRYHFPAVDSRVADFNRFCDWPTDVRFQIVDFDPYGSPYDAIENFFSEPRWECPLFVFVTDGVPLWMGRGGFLPAQLRCEEIARPVYDPMVRQCYFETLVWPWWHNLARQHGLSITKSALTWKTGKQVAYYALRLERDIS